MTRAEIIAELRRSAREDRSPWFQVAQHAYEPAYKRWIFGYDSAGDVMQDRTFFLLVACALEDEC